jgi:hypothetical protein
MSSEPLSEEEERRRHEDHAPIHQLQMRALMREEILDEIPSGQR